MDSDAGDGESRRRRLFSSPFSFSPPPFSLFGSVLSDLATSVASSISCPLLSMASFRYRCNCLRSCPSSRKSWTTVLSYASTVSSPRTDSPCEDELICLPQPSLCVIQVISPLDFYKSLPVSMIDLAITLQRTSQPGQKVWSLQAVLLDSVSPRVCMSRVIPEEELQPSYVRIDVSRRSIPQSDKEWSSLNPQNVNPYMSSSKHSHICLGQGLRYQTLLYMDVVVVFMVDSIRVFLVYMFDDGDCSSIFVATSLMLCGSNVHCFHGLALLVMRCLNLEMFAVFSGFFFISILPCIEVSTSLNLVSMGFFAIPNLPCIEVSTSFDIVLSVSFDIPNLPCIEVSTSFGLVYFNARSLVSFTSYDVYFGVDVWWMVQVNHDWAILLAKGSNFPSQLSTRNSVHLVLVAEGLDLNLYSLSLVEDISLDKSVCYYTKVFFSLCLGRIANECRRFLQDVSVPPSFGSIFRVIVIVFTSWLANVFTKFISLCVIIYSFNGV